MVKVETIAKDDKYKRQRNYYRKNKDRIVTFGTSFQKEFADKFDESLALVKTTRKITKTDVIRNAMLEIIAEAKKIEENESKNNYDKICTVNLNG
jgi:O-acetylhomoserine/O-acetylserine sulfhydrylase-like pyridoxal-dependent enzyme